MRRERRAAESDDAGILDLCDDFFRGCSDFTPDIRSAVDLREPFVAFHGDHHVHHHIAGEVSVRLHGRHGAGIRGMYAG